MGFPSGSAPDAVVVMVLPSMQNSNLQILHATLRARRGSQALYSRALQEVR